MAAFASADTDADADADARALFAREGEGARSGRVMKLFEPAEASGMLARSRSVRQRLRQ